MPPTNVRAFADISFDGNEITAQVVNYTLPVVQRARVDIPGKRTSYPKLGRLNPMSFTLTISSASAAYLGGLGVSHDIEVVEELETPGQPNYRTHGRGYWRLGSVNSSDFQSGCG